MAEIPALRDIDDAAGAPGFDAVRAHDRLAPFYASRAPYLPAFFDRLEARLNLSRRSRLIDLCCGRSELSAGLGEKVGHIDAVDASAEMLAHAIRPPNTSYHCLDANEAGALAHLAPADHVLIGSAIHWLRQGSLADTVATALVPGGAVVVTHAKFSFGKQLAGKALARLNQRYGKPPVEIDLTGRDKLQACGFAPDGDFTVQKPVRLPLEIVYRNQVSLAYGDFFDRIADPASRYRQDLIRTLTPFAEDGLLETELVNWAVVYRRS